MPVFVVFCLDDALELSYRSLLFSVEKQRIQCQGVIKLAQKHNLVCAAVFRDKEQLAVE